MVFAWDWTQRVLVSDKIVYVEWRHEPSTTWFYARGLTSFDLDGHLLDTSTLRLCQVIESHVHLLRPGHQLCVSVRTSTDSSVRTRAVCVLACYNLLHHHTLSVTDAWIPFDSLHIVPFFDRLSCLHVLDCVRGVDKARACGFIPPDHHHVDAPPFTWLSKKVLTFPSPSCTLDTFMPYFHAHNVTLILALHPPVYCFDTLDIEYMDLICPDDMHSDDIMLGRILDAIESTPGVVAVHGLHRIRTFLGGYLMRTHGFSAAEAAGWLHATHPYNVDGDQLFPHMLRRWHAVLDTSTDTRRDADARPRSSSSLKINIGGISFGSSLLLGSSTTKSQDKSTLSKKKNVPPQLVKTSSRSNDVAECGGSTSRGHSRERSLKTATPVQS
ncbi:hypothetical protein DYB28_001414 [Aphanomyces astaci]|uniref:Dual specificity/tyrosine protein phosphatase N-terminal domain-containing protein n=1 Tax=Aphanomyces astaci TaxID=112090 RepID=A0A9X8DZD7_APHAT|nr:hypothetical protein DYB28_001414 [Aphanomyces astaci]